MSNAIFRTEDTYTPDSLHAGSYKTDMGTLITGQNTVRGALLGKITKGAGTGAKISGTGDGTVGAVTLGADAQVGVYVLTCTAESANAGTFSVFAPDGTRLKDLTVAAAYTGTHINLTIADGANDWDVGDRVNVTVAAGSGKYKLSLAAAVDGSQAPDAILAETTDATDADATVALCVAGEFNEDSLTLGVGHTIASVKDGLRDKNIYLKSPVSA